MRHSALLLAPALAGCGAVQVAQLEKVLASRDSATEALGQWCAARHIAQDPTIKAERLADTPAPPSAAVRQALGVMPDEPVAYRHVRLNCGAATLSVAQNWYVPGRLTPEMNRVLGSSDVPFGKVVAPLRFTRERLESLRGPAEGCPAGTVLSHRAVLRQPSGQPFSLVVECYTEANLR